MALDRPHPCDLIGNLDVSTELERAHKGIESVKKTAPDAKVVDLTEQEPAQLARTAAPCARHEYTADARVGVRNEASKSTTAPSAPASSAAATSTASQPMPPQPVPSTTEAALRGYFSPLSFWEQTFSAATSQDCVLQGAQTFDSQHAWRLPSGGLVCAWGPSAYNDSWGGRLMTFSVYFDPHVDAQTAVRAVTNLLPTDIQQASSFDGVSNDGSKYPLGSCVELVYSSNALGDAVSRTNPTWTGDRNKVNFELYSGNTSSSDGADTPYKPHSIHLALVGIGGENRGLDGVIHC
jgi:hypothetical protein